MLFLTGIQDHYVSEEINKTLHKGFCNQERKKKRNHTYFIYSFPVWIFLGGYVCAPSSC